MTKKILLTDIRLRDILKGGGGRFLVKQDEIRKADFRRIRPNEQSGHRQRNKKEFKKAHNGFLQNMHAQNNDDTIQPSTINVSEDSIARHAQNNDNATHPSTINVSEDSITRHAQNNDDATQPLNH
ncbi:hypothetical protein JTE90_020288 [Oedothorax gibbosus]|uniref:Uncharacterized protein n=1 Tax=Oedothorax gibbosus TaxID=931172 RepID=A0AAV6VMM1_9ARAC|nr:hypothetical protein JTE90_020288 [Oedothorax gibbosus]